MRAYRRQFCLFVERFSLQQRGDIARAQPVFRRALLAVPAHRHERDVARPPGRNEAGKRGGVDEAAGKDLVRFSRCGDKPLSSRAGRVDDGLSVPVKAFRLRRRVAKVKARQDLSAALPYKHGIGKAFLHRPCFAFRTDGVKLLRAARVQPRLQRKGAEHVDDDRRSPRLTGAFEQLKDLYVHDRSPVLFSAAASSGKDYSLSYYNAPAPFCEIECPIWRNMRNIFWDLRFFITAL